MLSADSSLLHGSAEEHVAAFNRLIDEVKSSYANIERAQARDHNAPSAHNRWATLSKQIIDTLGNEPTWANIVEYPAIADPATAPQDADVWRLSPLELETLVAQGRTLDRTILLRGNSTTAAADFEAFLSSLKSYSYVDVQDLSRPPNKVVCHMPTSTVIKRVKRGLEKLRQSSLPLNLLNMEDITNQTPRVAPSILSGPRFQLLGEVCARLRDKLPPGGPFTRNPGKRDFLAACSTFGIFAQRGAFSGPHCDALVGTWIHNIKGIKAWPIIPNLNGEEADLYALQGSFWQPSPGSSKVILLNEGDTLIMPAGKCIIHCPLTVSDCYMVGGMFWDEKCLLDILRGIMWTARSPVITNEPLSRQMPEVLRVLRQMIEEDPDRFRGRMPKEVFFDHFDQLAAEIEEQGSCSCCAVAPGGCKCKWETCKCSLYGGRCNEWCHARSTAPAMKLGSSPARSMSSKVATSTAPSTPLKEDSLIPEQSTIGTPPLSPLSPPVSPLTDVDFRMDLDEEPSNDEPRRPDENSIPTKRRPVDESTLAVLRLLNIPVGPC